MFRLKNRNDLATLAPLAETAADFVRTWGIPVDKDAVSGLRLLLVDDLYRSGATATLVAQELLAAGRAPCISWR